MIVEIKGVEFENKGSELMLRAIADKLRARWPAIRFALRVNSKTPAKHVTSFPALRKIPLRKNYLDFNNFSYFLPDLIRHYLIKLGFVLEADIDMIIDASGFSYSDEWSAKLRIYHLKNELERFHKNSKPYIFLPQAFGPFSNKSSCSWIASSFKYAAMICARELVSYNFIEGVAGPLTNLHQYPDFTNMLQGSVRQTSRSSNHVVYIIPNRNMTKTNKHITSWKMVYHQLIAKVINCYREMGLDPYFLNHSGSFDEPTILDINSFLSMPIGIEIVSDPLEIKGMIGTAKAVFSSRYHGCVSALSQGKPCIATSWSHKYDLLYDQYGATELLLKPNSTDRQIKRVVDISLNANSRLHRRIRDEAYLEQRRTQTMWDKFFEIVTQYDAFSKQVL